MNLSLDPVGKHPTVSLIIPLYNEAGSLPSLLKEITDALRPLRQPFEILAVDDGSTDGTGDVLSELMTQIPELRLLRHDVNRGQGPALWTGFENASGEIIITLDGDGQNDPRDIPRMLELLKDCDAVFGQRTGRQDPLPKRIGTRIAYGFRRAVLGDRTRDTACTLKAMKRTVLKHLIPTRMFFLFIPFLCQIAGVPFTTCEVNHRPRQKGRSKYSFRKLYFLRPLSDLMFMWWLKRNLISFKNYEEDRS